MYYLLFVNGNASFFELRMIKSFPHDCDAAKVGTFATWSIWRTVSETIEMVRRSALIYGLLEFKEQWQRLVIGEGKDLCGVYAAQAACQVDPLEHLAYQDGNLDGNPPDFLAHKGCHYISIHQIRWTGHQVLAAPAVYACFCSTSSPSIKRSTSLLTTHLPSSIMLNVRPKSLRLILPSAL